MLVQLHVLNGSEAGRQVLLNDGQALQIGRGADTDLPLPDLYASRKHCCLAIEDGRFILRDLGSAAGTYVNGEQVTSRELRVGDVIRIGNTDLRLDAAAPHLESTIVPAPGRARRLPIGSLNDLTGQSLAHFVVGEAVAVGQSGVVFRATDTQRERPAAIKVLFPEISGNEEDFQRFVRAMKTMLPVRHENVEMYAVGKNGPYCWVAMEYVEGGSLMEVIERLGSAGKLDWRSAFRVAVHLARALEKAEEHRIVHRNITPRNILIRQSDKVSKLGDLMLAKALEGSLARPVTRPGQMVGEVAYMSPERTRSGVPIDCRADIYSLGATCYALLTGRPPFEGLKLPTI